MNICRKLLPAVALLLVSAIAATSQAQYPMYPSGLLGVGGFRGLYGAGHFEKRPYFALNPPVYYSHPVARPYGYSPYALPPGMAPVELTAPTPEVIANPHFKEDSAVRPIKPQEKAANKKVVSRIGQATPEMISNQFYPGAAAVNVAKRLEL